MKAFKTTIRDAATLILVARNTTLNSHFDYRVLLLERGAKSAFMVSVFFYFMARSHNRSGEGYNRVSIKVN